MTTRKEIVDRIYTIAPRISSEILAGARHVPEASASPGECFSNAERKAQQEGGGVLYGWMFQYREVVTLPGPGYLIAVNHAVWLAPDKTLIDVTPFHSDQTLHPIVINGDVVLFLIDSTATPLKNEHVGLTLPSWFFPLMDNEAMAQHVAKRTFDELAEWERQVEQTDGLQGSRRATDLLESRRGGK